MPFSEVIRLAFESLIANKLRSLLTMLGMIIGVGAVVLLVSIGNGAKNYITSEFHGLGTNLILVQPGKSDGKSSFGPPVGGSNKPLTLQDVEAIERQSFNLEALTGLMFGTGVVRAQSQTINVNVLGSSEKLFQIFYFKIQTGTFLSHEEVETSRRVVVLGFKASQTLFNDLNPLGQLVKINDSEFRVIGVLVRSGQKLGFDMDHIAIIPTKTAMQIFNDHKLFGIRAKAKSLAALNDAAQEIRNILKLRHNGQEDFTVLTQASMLETLNTILNMLTYVLGGIAMISMVVGGIGIMNIMLVSVRERTREIGVRRAVGARKKDVLFQFLVEAMVLSLVGGLVGLMGSVFLTHLISWFVPGFDMRAPLWICIPAFLVSFFVGVLFGVWPARQASNIETIDALRYE